jgi:peptidoglycan/LPS O-acetylase OafA/YrhL
MDGLRGILAFYVMLGHALPFTTLPAWATAPFSHGEAAVDLFFALSGLVILNSLERFNNAFRPFMAARARRLLPVYFTALALSLTLLLTTNPLATMPWATPAAQAIWESTPPPHLAWHLLAHLTLTQGLIPQPLLPYAYVTLLGPAWSLSTEWQFYTALALLRPKHLTAPTLAFLALGLAYHLHPLPSLTRAFLPDAAPYFALGLATAALLRTGNRPLFAAVLLATCATGLLQSPEKALTPLIWAAAVAAQNAPWGAILASKPLQFLGAISYPLYLLNEPTQRALATLIPHQNPTLFTAIWLPLALTTPLLAAAFLHHTLEAESSSFLKKRTKKLLLIGGDAGSTARD